MSIIEQIKAEIDKLYGEYKYKFHQCGDQYHLGLIDGLDMAERVLDSLESGKPVPNDLEEAAKEYAKTTFKKPHSDNPDEEVTIVEPDKYAGFIAGARYEDEQLSEKIAAAYQLGLADKEKQIMKDFPKWRRIKEGERLPCPAYVWTIAYDNYPDCFEGRLMPNVQGVKVGRDTWYLPVDVIHNLPKED